LLNVCVHLDEARNFNQLLPTHDSVKMLLEGGTVALGSSRIDLGVCNTV
jgi:hypothetical protein